MPIFEFKCEKCNIDCELLVFNKTQVKCPECGSGNLRKKMSIFGMGGISKDSPGVSASNASSCGSCTKSSCSSC